MCTSIHSVSRWAGRWVVTDCFQWIPVLVHTNGPSQAATSFHAKQPGYTLNSDEKEWVLINYKLPKVKTTRYVLRRPGRLEVSAPTLSKHEREAKAAVVSLKSYTNGDAYAHAHADAYAYAFACAYGDGCADAYAYAYADGCA